MQIDMISFTFLNIECTPFNCFSDIYSHVYASSIHKSSCG